MPEIKFLGHACVAIETANHKLIIDPFLNGNSQASIKAEDVITDYILLTHAHGDHFGDTELIAKKNEATVIATFELGTICERLGLKVHKMHIGGAFNFDFGKVKMTIAHHGGGLGHDADQYAGPPAGLLIYVDGKTIYHAGDTGLFLDMKLIGEMNNIDLAFLPIGDNFTMGIDDAVKAVEFLNPKKVVPCHYNTFPIIEQDPGQFADKVKNSEVIIMNPGESVSL